MKLNWGKSLALVMILFMAFILYMVIQMFGANVDLVEEDYYEQEVRYDERRDALRNSLEFKDEMDYVKEEGAIRVVFPEELDLSNSVGSMLLYNSSEAARDKVFPIVPSMGNEQLILLNPQDNGSYVVKIKLDVQSKSYYFEKDIIL